MYKPGDAVYFKFPIQSATGAATNADSTPTAVLSHNNSVDATVTITIASSGTTGGYKGTFTVPSSGYAAGDTISVEATAIVSGVTGPPVTVFRDVLDTSRTSEVYGRIGAPTGASIAADIQTRSTYAGGAVASVTGNVGGNVAGSVGSVASGVTVATNNDKTGYALTSDEHESIATTVEAHLLDEGDSQMLINAIVGAIGNTNIDQTVLVAAIRADLERAGGNLNTVITRLTSARAAYLDNLNVTGTLANTDNADTFKADVPTVSDIAAEILLTPANKLATDASGNASIDDSDILSALSEISSGAGEGARTVTVTVTDADNAPIQRATVRLQRNGFEDARANTGNDGSAVLNVDDGAWSYTVTRAGYTSASGSITVDGAESLSITLTAYVIAPASDPSDVNVLVRLRDLKLAARKGVSVALVMEASEPRIGSTFIQYGGEAEGKTNADGEKLLPVRPSSFWESEGISPTTYALKIDGDVFATGITVPDEDSNVATLIRNA